MTTEATEAFRAANYEIAEAIAPSWERRRADIEAFTGPVREWMLHELRLRAGDTVLELAAGVGDTGLEAAALVGERGRLISTDFSPSMVEAARRRGSEAGARNVEFRVIDAERIALEDGSVDRVLCRFGYMLMPDAGAALGETHRVLRPGGRVTLAVWGAAERNPFFATVAISLFKRDRIPPLEPPPAPGPFNMASPERTAALLDGAGFGQVRTEEVDVRIHLPSVDEYLSLIADTAGPLGLALRALPDGERAEVRAEVEDAFARYATGDGYDLPGVALCAAGEVRG